MDNKSNRELNIIYKYDKIEIEIENCKDTGEGGI